MYSKLTILFFAAVCMSCLLHANEDNNSDRVSEEEKSKDSNENETTLKIGNLSLRPTQQPAPLVGFGETVIDKGEVQLFLIADQYKKKRGYLTNVGPAFIYGITDNFSLFVNWLDSPRNKEMKYRSSGLEDVYVQLEYAYYNKSRQTYTEQATVIAAITLPTGSSSKIPETGLGSPSFFIGGNFNHTAIDWFYFGSLGAFLTTFHKNSKAADVYLYQAGIGRNIASPPGWIFAWMVEFDGVYSSKSISEGEVDPDSGGNVIFVTPSLWISSEKIVFQLGVGGVITQNLYGNQSHFTHQFVSLFAYTF